MCHYYKILLINFFVKNGLLRYQMKATSSIKGSEQNFKFRFGLFHRFITAMQSFCSKKNTHRDCTFKIPTSTVTLGLLDSNAIPLCKSPMYDRLIKKRPASNSLTCSKVSVQPCLSYPLPEWLNIVCKYKEYE